MFQQRFKIPNHERLHPKLWNADRQLHLDAWEILNRIAVSAMALVSTHTHIPIDMEYDIKDIIIGGSCVEYFYTKKSDLDMKIILRPDRYLKVMDEQTYIEFIKMLRTLFREKFKPHVKGIEVDLGIIAERFDMPCYSVKHNKWLHEPRRLTSDEIQYLEKRAKIYYLSMKRMIRHELKNKESHDKSIKLYGMFKTRRNQSWNEKWKNKEPFCFAFSRLSKETLIKKLFYRELKYTRRLLLDIKTNPA